MADTKPPAKKGGNFLTRKHGPLPTWAYIVIAVGLLVALAWWKTRQAGKQQSAKPDTASGSGKVPQFVNQTYVQPGPPSSEKPDDDDDKHRRHHKGLRPHRRGVGSHDPEPVRHPGGTGTGGGLPGGGTFGPPPQRGGGNDWRPSPGG